MANLAGKVGYVKLGATSYGFSNWKFAMKAGLPKTTNFLSAGFRANVTGIIEGTITCKGPYDHGAMPLICGNEYAFTLGFDSGIELTCNAKIESLEPDDDVEGTPMVSITAQSNGVFTAAIV